MAKEGTIFKGRDRAFIIGKSHLIVPIVCPLTGSMTIPSLVVYLVMSKTDKTIAHAMKIDESANIRPWGPCH